MEYIYGRYVNMSARFSQEPAAHEYATDKSGAVGCLPPWHCFNNVVIVVEPPPPTSPPSQQTSVVSNSHTHTHDIVSTFKFILFCVAPASASQYSLPFRDGMWYAFPLMNITRNACEITADNQVHKHELNRPKRFREYIFRAEYIGDNNNL